MILIIIIIVEAAESHPFLGDTMFGPWRAFWGSSTLRLLSWSTFIHTCFTHELLHDIRWAVFAGLHCHTRPVSILPKRPNRGTSQLLLKIRWTDYCWWHICVHVNVVTEQQMPLQKQHYVGTLLLHGFSQRQGLHIRRVTVEFVEILHLQFVCKLLHTPRQRSLSPGSARERCRTGRSHISLLENQGQKANNIRHTQSQHLSFLLKRNWRHEVLTSWILLAYQISAFRPESHSKYPNLKGWRKENTFRACLFISTFFKYLVSF